MQAHSRLTTESGSAEIMVQALYKDVAGTQTACTTSLLHHYMLTHASQLAACSSLPGQHRAALAMQYCLLLTCLHDQQDNVP